MTPPRETFIKVPTFVMELACTGAISPRAFLLYTVLRSHRNNETQTAWASNAKLAEEMGIAHRQNVPRLMRELVETGAVKKRSRSGTSNVYAFPEVPTVITRDDTRVDTVITGDYTRADTVITGDNPPESQVITPRNQPVYPPVITGDVLTRQSELDRETRSIERSADAGSSSAVAKTATSDAGRLLQQPPLMQSVPTSGRILGPGQPRAYLELKLGRELHEVEEAVAAAQHAKGKRSPDILKSIQALRIPA